MDQTNGRVMVLEICFFVLRECVLDTKLLYLFFCEKFVTKESRVADYEQLDA